MFLITYPPSVMVIMLTARGREVIANNASAAVNQVVFINFDSMFIDLFSIEMTVIHTRNPNKAEAIPENPLLSRCAKGVTKVTIE